MSLPTSPTLLVFTLGPAAERTRRPLLPRDRSGKEVALRRRLLERALAAGRHNGCRLEVSTPKRLRLDGDVRVRSQTGAGFGDRLRRAVRGAENRSQGSLVVVGTDAPGLAASHVAAALAYLDTEPEAIVVGPSPDGGFYLLASRRPLDPVLARVSWCRRLTLETLQRRARACGRAIHLLEPLDDLDRPADLEAWLTSRCSEIDASLKLWIRRLRRLLADLRRPIEPDQLGLPRPELAPSIQGRAPPRSGRLPPR